MIMKMMMIRKTNVNEFQYGGTKEFKIKRTFVNYRFLTIVYEVLRKSNGLRAI